ncbi:MAG: MFS transporter [Candidatus Limnocylindrales bacterium]
MIGYISLLAAGYAYNLTFVQLGLSALAGGPVGLSETEVASAMAGLALVTCLGAIGAGLRLRGASFRTKLRLTALVVAAQTLLTAFVPAIDGPAVFWPWLGLAAVTLGLGVPASFGLATDLVPVRWRGLTAAAITALAYGGAIAFLGEWEARALAERLLPLMVLGTVGLAALALEPGPLRQVTDRLSGQAALAEYGQGRFSGPGAERRLLIAAGLLFAVFFVDSLGFIRLVESPFVTSSWQSSELVDRGTLIGAHAIGALAGGILYSTFDERFLWPWIFGIFGLVAMIYVFDVRLGAFSQALAMPILYAVAVSLYTVVTFALWPDLSTPDTITRNVAVGVAISGWTATFASTALALVWRSSGMDFDRHLSMVAAISLLVMAAFGTRALFRHEPGSSA